MTPSETLPTVVPSPSILAPHFTFSESSSRQVPQTRFGDNHVHRERAHVNHVPRTVHIDIPFFLRKFGVIHYSFRSKFVVKHLHRIAWQTPAYQHGCHHPSHPEVPVLSLFLFPPCLSYPSVSFLSLLQSPSPPLPHPTPPSHSPSSSLPTPSYPIFSSLIFTLLFSPYPILSHLPIPPFHPPLLSLPHPFPSPFSSLLTPSYPIYPSLPFTLLSSSLPTPSYPIYPSLPFTLPFTQKHATINPSVQVRILMESQLPTMTGRILSVYSSANVATTIAFTSGPPCYPILRHPPPAHVTTPPPMSPPLRHPPPILRHPPHLSSLAPPLAPPLRHPPSFVTPPSFVPPPPLAPPLRHRPILCHPLILRHPPILRHPLLVTPHPSLPPRPCHTRLRHLLLRHPPFP
ncbi:hypothetical protein Pcinc_031886 [Petrolisthes cinctipes]|uniref:Uncharacterized protein n=1 Tax=Petrolisthes cinctipes TaxID=88211 RepID=A0AAE1EVQ4_PETCI|nr:hypothetical protein Pcinc_031886 [Petrolisthes cinctipes]